MLKKLVGFESWELELRFGEIIRVVFQERLERRDCGSWLGGLLGVYCSNGFVKGRQS